MVLRQDPEQGDIFCPTIFCGHCAQEITDAKDGLIGWFPNWPIEGDGNANPMQVYMMHRRCNRAFEAGFQGQRGRMYWDRLSRLPTMLAANLKGVEE